MLIAQSGRTPEAIIGEQGLLAQLTNALVERVLGAELSPDFTSSVTEAVHAEVNEWQKIYRRRDEVWLRKAEAPA